MFRNYDTWKADDAPDPGRVEDVEGCADCGDLICTCDERCPGCMKKFTSAADADFGMCVPCRIDLAESLRDEVA